MTLILQTFPMPAGPPANLEREYEVRQALFPGNDELTQAATGAVGVIAGTESWPGDLFGEVAGTLRCISRVGTGVDSIDLKAATEAGVVVLNGPVCDISPGPLRTTTPASISRRPPKPV